MEEILKEIQDSFKMLLLEEGWNENGSPKINRKSFSMAIEALMRMINQIGITENPEINPCPDGSVDISWRTKNKTRLLINMRDEKMFWYGDDGKEGDKIEGNTNGCYDECLFKWIKRRF